MYSWYNFPSGRALGNQTIAFISGDFVKLGPKGLKIATIQVSSPVVQFWERLFLEDGLVSKDRHCLKGQEVLIPGANCMWETYYDSTCRHPGVVFYIWDLWRWTGPPQGHLGAHSDVWNPSHCKIHLLFPQKPYFKELVSLAFLAWPGILLRDTYKTWLPPRLMYPPSIGSVRSLTQMTFPTQQQNYNWGNP